MYRGKTLYLLKKITFHLTAVLTSPSEVFKSAYDGEKATEIPTFDKADWV